MALQKAFAAFTHQGRRRENQDAVVSTSLPGGRQLLIVADGMGGHLGGSRASSLASAQITEMLASDGSIQEAIDSCQARLHQVAVDENLQGMGTTVTGVIVDGDELQIFNIGDSRAYLITRERIDQLTEDHSFVAESVRKGTMSEAEALASRWANALTRSLGGAEGEALSRVETDIFGPIQVLEPSVLLLCSDGLYKAVPDNLIRDVVAGTADIEIAARALASVAFRRGSDDNISVVLCEFGSMERDLGAITLPEDIDEQWAREERPPQTRASASPTVHLPAQAPASVTPRRRWAIGLIAFLLLAALVWLGVTAFPRVTVMEEPVTPQVIEPVQDASDIPSEAIESEDVDTEWEYIVREDPPIMEDSPGGLE